MSVSCLSLVPRGLQWSLLLAASVACAAHAQAPAASPASASPAQAAQPAMVLLLPAPSSALGPAAEALRQGFFAAHQVSGDDIALQVVELDDNGEQLSRALVSARERGARLIVGPLPRAAVTDVVEGRRAETPLLALNFPESDGAAPSSMLATSLSLEAEAQRVATLALSEFIGMRRTDTRPRIAVISRPGALERRIAQAYVSAARAEGDVPVQVEWTAETTPRVAALLAEPSLEAVFLALTARDAAQLRAIIPRDLPVFGTSLLYAGDPVSSPESATLARDLEGIRFLEMPWLLQPEHPAVMIYPPPAAAWPLELRRLYAFGIDAYRLGIAWMKGERRFELDGVTGRLRVDRAQSLRVQRTPLLAVYRNGVLQRIDLSR
jgi:outer membrane PBP1 activator LpoA protein